MGTLIQRFRVVAALSGWFAQIGCSGEGYPPTGAAGSTSSSGVTSTGGVASGGTATGAVGAAPSSSGGSAAGSGGGGGALTSANGGASGSSGGFASSGANGGAGMSGATASGGATGGATLNGGSGPGPSSGGASGGTASNGGVSGAGTSKGGAGSNGQGGSGTGGSTSSSGGAAAVSFAQVEVIVGNNCAGCHVNRRPILTAMGSALYNTLTSTVVKQCTNHKLVAPGSSSSSALIELVTNKCNGFRMPTSCSTDMCLVSEEFAALTAWINAGAKGP